MNYDDVFLTLVARYGSICYSMGHVSNDLEQKRLKAAAHEIIDAIKQRLSNNTPNYVQKKHMSSVSKSNVVPS